MILLITNGTVEIFTAGATYGMKGANAGQAILCFFGGGPASFLKSTKHNL
jgi:hypothetical protein